MDESRWKGERVRNGKRWKGRESGVSIGTRGVIIIEEAKKERKEGKRVKGKEKEEEEREEGSGRSDRLLLPPHPNFNQDPKYASRMDACEHSRRYYRALRCM